MARRAGEIPELEEGDMEDEEELWMSGVSGVQYRPIPPDVAPVERYARNSGSNNSASGVGHGGPSNSAGAGSGGNGRGGGGKKAKTNGYLLYIFHRRKQLERETGEKVGGGVNEAMKMFDAEWKALAETEKAIWKEKAKQQNGQ